MNFRNFIEARKPPRPPDHVVEVRDIQHVYELLKQYSMTEGGAWAWHIMPFSHECRFYKHPSPSKVPFDEMDSMRTNEYEKGAIGWKGQIVPFSLSQIIRDQKRGYGKD
jgi:hypothetical protein